MQIQTLTLGDFLTNCYLVRGGESARCILVDPADDGPAIERAMDALGTTPDAVLLTHGHYDHILAVPHLQKRWPALPVYCHPLDCPKELTEVWDGETYPTVTTLQNLRPYGEGDEVHAAGLAVRVLHTPGHTPGSVTLLVEDVLFTGDTLFQGDVGSTEFPGGDDRALAASLTRLCGLPGDYKVLPGHDEATTLASERRSNPYLPKTL